MGKVSFFLMSRKGYVVIRDIIKYGYATMVEQVIIAHDKNMLNDYYDEILNECKKANIIVHDKNETIEVNSDFCIAISWRWLIQLNKNIQLVVLHDSLLPRYRGFSPLVNMLINKEPYIGVTAIFASEEYDKGNVILQRKVAVTYPIKINDAIDLITPLYSEIICWIFENLRNQFDLQSTPQIENEGSYSLWRDEDDYHVDWNGAAEDILQFIYSVGYPFKGAFSIVNGKKIRIYDGCVINDVVVENRQIGKVLFVDNGFPVVVCNQGLIKITEASYDDGTNALPLNSFRMRFL